MNNELPPVPRGLDLSQEAGDVIIRRRWYSLAAYFLVLFTLFWLGFLCFWYWQAFHQKHFEWMMVLFPLIHVAVGLGMLYYTVCLFCNTTEVRINRDLVRVQTYPLPWFGNLDLAAGNITGTRIRQRRNKNSVTYQLVYVNPDNREKSLLWSCGSQENAEFIEYFVRRAAGLQSAGE
jgi:hypothetical protein